MRMCTLLPFCAVSSSVSAELFVYVPALWLELKIVAPFNVPFHTHRSHAVWSPGSAILAATSTRLFYLAYCTHTHTKRRGTRTRIEYSLDPRMHDAFAASRRDAKSWRAVGSLSTYDVETNTILCVCCLLNVMAGLLVCEPHLYVNIFPRSN